VSYNSFHTITIHEDVVAMLEEVESEYDCDSLAEAVEEAVRVALEQDETDLARMDDGKLAQTLADRLAK